MKKTKVLHLITQLRTGGAQKVVLDLCLKSNTSKFEVVVVSLMALEDTVIQRQLQAQQIPVESLNISKSPFSLLKSIAILFQILKKHQISILHAHLIHANIIATLLKIRMPSLKLVFTAHTFKLESKFRELFTFLTKKMRSADIIFSQNMHSAIYKKEVSIIPNGIAISDYQVNTKKFNQFTFLCIGRLDHPKNQLALIEPIKALKNKGYQFQLLLVGEGKDEDKINAAVKANNLESHITLLGLRTDIPLLCNQAHCLIMSSLWEGLPIVILEAGASSLPIISTSVGSIPTVIDHNSGYLIPNTNQLASKMQEVMDNYGIAINKGKTLYQTIVSRFDIATVVKKHEQLYTTLAAVR